MEAALRAAREAGDLLISRFREPQVVASKGDRNPVTATDLDAERTILAVLTAEFPGHAILSEESHPDTRTDDWLWVIDPLDGTRNYLSGIPFFCVNIALAHGGEVLLGVTHDPVHNETFAADRGRGATCNGRPIAASLAPTVAESVVGVDLGYVDVRARRMLELVEGVWPRLQAVRITGSSALALAYVAAGRLDLYVHHYLYPWDFAAGLALIPEAGGQVTERAGGMPTLAPGTILAGGPGAHADALAVLRGLPWE